MPPFPRWIEWLRDNAPYAYLTRFPTILAAALVMYGPFAHWILPGMFQTTLVLDPAGMRRLALAATLSAFTVMTTRRVILVYGHLRFGSVSARTPARLRRRQVLFYSMLAYPLIGFVIANSYRETTLRTVIGAAALGVGLGWLTLVAVHLVQSLLVSPHRMVPDALLPSHGHVTRALRKQDLVPVSVRTGGIWLLGRWQAILGPGYLDDDGALLANHGLSSAMFALYFLVYLFYYFRAQPGTEAGSAVPTLVYLLILITMWTWILAGLAFYLDRHRIPTLVAIVSLSALVSVISHSDHYFMHAPDSMFVLASPADIVKRDPQLPVVVFAADGGGIQASAWNARVLTGVQDGWPAFRRALRLVSSVSGGSVGAMYFLNALHPNYVDDIGAVRILARRDSLNEVAWGLAYPDFWRALLPIPRSWAFIKDRGWALEQAWGRNWPGGKMPTLSAWARETTDGWRPAVAFNATAVEKGQRFLIASFAVPTAWDTEDFFCAYEGRDIDVVTAARLSATFPYVTPVSRAWPASKDTRSLHLADAGYYDNTGMLTAMQWLNEVIIHNHESLEGRRVMFIQGVSAPDFSKDVNKRDERDRNSWYQLVAPIEIMLDVRQAGQLDRVEKQFELLRDYWQSHNVTVDLYKFQFGGNDVPTSWKLSAVQRAAINAEWNHGCNAVRIQRLLVAAGELAIRHDVPRGVPVECSGNY